MGDLIMVQHGLEPWRPADNASLVVEYDRFDVPTVGVVRQHGVEHLFRAVSGLGTPVTLWAYNHLSRQERQALEGADDFQAVLDSMHLFPAVLAIAAEGYGIVSALEADGTEDPKAVVDALVDAFGSWVERYRTAAAQQRGEFAYTP